MKLTVIFAVIHCALFLLCFVTAFSQTMYRFDHPETAQTLLERTCGMVTSILIQPYGVLAGSVALHSPVLDWAGMLLNSIFWGATFAFVVMRLRNPRSSVRHA